MSARQFLMIKVANCSRCAVRLKVADKSNPYAKLLKKAITPKALATGFCPNCCATEWLQTTEGVREQLAYRRCRRCNKRRALLYPGNWCDCETPDVPPIGELLGLEHVQQQFERVMRAGNADAKPDELDWLEIIANWDLEFPLRLKR